MRSALTCRFPLCPAAEGLRRCVQQMFDSKFSHADMRPGVCSRRYREATCKGTADVAWSLGGPATHSLLAAAMLLIAADARSLERMGVARLRRRRRCAAGRLRQPRREYQARAVGQARHVASSTRTATASTATPQRRSSWPLSGGNAASGTQANPSATIDKGDRRSPTRGSRSKDVYVAGGTLQRGRHARGRREPSSAAMQPISALETARRDDDRPGQPGGAGRRRQRRRVATPHPSRVSRRRREQLRRFRAILTPSKLFLDKVTAQGLPGANGATG